MPQILSLKAFVKKKLGIRSKKFDDAIDEYLTIAEERLKNRFGRGDKIWNDDFREGQRWAEGRVLELLRKGEYY